MASTSRWSARIFPAAFGMAICAVLAASRYEDGGWPEVGSWLLQGVAGIVFGLAAVELLWRLGRTLLSRFRR